MNIDVAKVIGRLGPMIPGILTIAESTFGHSSITGVKSGESKLDLAVNLGTSILATLANQGTIPPAAVNHPELKPALTAVLESSVDAMKVNGNLGAGAVKPIPISGTLVFGTQS